MSDPDPAPVPLRGTVAVALLVMLAAFLAFSPTIGYEFLRYDDEMYVSTNPHIRPLTFDTVIWLFTHPYFQTYTPLTFLSHAVDIALWGDDARGHHLTNVILHSLNAGLVVFLGVLLLQGIAHSRGNRPDARVVLPGAALGGLIFALHPLRVESVAWISDRKDLLMAFFLFLSCLAYVVSLRSSSDAGAGRAYRLSIAAFVLAVLSKTSAIAAPVALVVLDLLVAGREAAAGRTLVRKKIPFLAIAAAGGVAAVLAAQGAARHEIIAHAGAVHHLLLPLYTLAFLAWKFLWPAMLTPLYEQPGSGTLAVGAAATVLVSAVAIVQLLRRRATGFVAGWAAYVVLMVPVLAGVYAGIQPWADRYTYVPQVALSLLAGGTVAWFRSQRSGGKTRGLVLLTGAVVIGLLAAATFRQLPRWKDSVTLWTYAASTAPKSVNETLIPLGVAYFHAGKPDSAVALYRRALLHDPQNARAHFSLGEALAAMGDLRAASRSYFEALRHDTSHVGAANNLADVYLRMGDIERSLDIYRALARRDPESPQAQNNLGYALLRRGDYPAAADAFRTAIRLAPGFISPRVNLGVLYQTQGKPDDARQVLEGALRLNADDPGVNYNLGLVYEALKRPAEAESAYRRALVARPRYLDAWINLGNLFTREGRLEDARALYRDVAALIPESPELCLNLAGVFNALGMRDSAFAALREALRRNAQFAPAQYAIGLLHRAAGDSAKAREALEAAARLGSREAAALLVPPGPGQARRGRR